MSVAVFEQMKRYIGFEDRDAENLRVLRNYLAPHQSYIADRFYRVVAGHQPTRDILTSSDEHREELRRTLINWLEGLFTGVYDESYCQERLRIGRAHVRLGLPQHFMVMAIEVVWRELEAFVHALPRKDKHDLLASLHKLLTLESGLMVEGYRQTYAEHVRQLERDAVRARLSEAEQLAQIGRLAATLAHEVKNPLAGISGAIQVIRDNMKPDDAHRPILAEVLRQISRLDRTVKDLLVYARPKPPRTRECDIVRITERVITLLCEEPNFQKVRCEHVIDEAPPRIQVDEGQLEQLLMNLLLNAAQASTEGGTVRVSSSPADDGVRVVVQDQGCGMSEEVARRAAEPFYTTKARGTGLGLPICHKIVEAHGGKLRIDSVEGEGTSVVVDLPRKPPSHQALPAERST